MSNVLSSRNRKVRKFNLDRPSDSKRTANAKRQAQFMRQQRAIKRSQFA